jgi:hypothetical protein
MKQRQRWFDLRRTTAPLAYCPEAIAGKHPLDERFFTSNRRYRALPAAGAKAL